MRHLLRSIISVVGCFVAAGAFAQQPLHLYVTTGDNLTVSDWTPLDSPETIGFNLERMQATYNVQRIYWRGSSLTIKLDDFNIRPENPLFYSLWQWFRQESDQQLINQAAVDQAHTRHMDIYLTDGMFDHGAPGDTGGAQVFPYQTQDNLAVEHPDWVSVDRWGERTNSGVIEFCYPEARAALVDRYVNLLNQFGYDGVCLYTYAENYGSTYPEEYGFNQPIVDEFQRRYGVDIRNQTFDKAAWYALRGEYVTQFLKELHTALSQIHKRLVVSVAPPNPDLATAWPINTDLPRAEMAKMDWRQWIRQGATDELMTWYGGDPHILASMIRLVQSVSSITKSMPIPVRIGTGTPFNPAYADLVSRGYVMVPALMPGSSLDNYTNQVTTADDLVNPSWLMRGQALLDTVAGKISPSTDQIAALVVADPNVLVRREAIRTIAALNATDQVSVVETALGDLEPSVRIAAANALGLIGRPESIGLLLKTLQPGAGLQYEAAVLGVLNANRPYILGQLYIGLQSDSVECRQICARALQLDTSLATTNALCQAVRNDPDLRVRYYAVQGVVNRRNGDAFNTMMTALLDPEPTVQLAAATGIPNWNAGMPTAQHMQMLNALDGLFSQYGQNSVRSDRDWGWRVVGNALYAFGSDGQARLQAHLISQDDPYLAYYGYASIYRRILPQTPSTTTETQVVNDHSTHAPVYPRFRP